MSGSPGDPGPEASAPDASYEIRYLDLIRRRQQAVLSPPMAQEPMLPLHRLDPEMFERLVAEYVWLPPDTRGVRLYGRRGQADYGLDAVATSWSGTVAVYQAKRYLRIAARSPACSSHGASPSRSPRTTATSAHPGGGIRRGSVLAVSEVTGSMSLLLALLAGAMADGSWVGVTGVAGVGVEAAAQAGVPLGRLIRS